MDGQRVGRIVRALRRRRGWRQADLARAAGCSQQTVSVVERGHGREASLAILERLVGALDASLVVELRWRGAAVDRLLDEGHAALVATVADRLKAADWQAHVEVTYSEWGERGSFDILAARGNVVLVVEVKTEIGSVEATLRKLDEKARLASTIGRDRLGWHVRHVGRLLVLSGRNTTRRQVARHAPLFERALPARGPEVRNWLAQPAGPMAGLLFVSDTSPGSAIRRRGGPERVRCPKNASRTSRAGR